MKGGLITACMTGISCTWTEISWRSFDESTLPGKRSLPDYDAEEVPVIMVHAHSVGCEIDPDDIQCSKFEGDPAEEDVGKEWQYV